MKLLYGILLFAGFFALNNADAGIAQNIVATHQLAMSNLLQARAADPETTIACFNIYLAQISEISQIYNESYIACGTEADAQRAQLELEGSGNRTLISDGAQNVCQSMNDCSANSNTLAFLDCYGNLGDTNLKAIFILTSNATDVAADLREQDRVIENDLEKCQNATSRTYVESATAADQALQYCLVNGTPAPPETTTPEPASTPEPEPETTTEEETTVGAETTTEEDAAPEEEDLSRSAPLSPKLLAVSRLNSLNRKQN